MNVNGSSLFCDTELAARIERAEARMTAMSSAAAAGRRVNSDGFVIPVAGGVASYAEEGSPFNKVSGLGFDGVPAAAALDEIEEAFQALGAPVQVELAHIADPAVGALLSERGYRLESFENVLGLALAGAIERVYPPGVKVRPSGGDEFDLWLEVVAEAAAHPDLQGTPWREEFPRELYLRAQRDAAVAGVSRYVAVLEGTVAGGAGLRIEGGVAQLAGAGTVPARRRRGVQTALVTARLADAADAGCDIAVITTQPGSKSQQNAQRRGFELLYTRAVLVKPQD